MDPTRVWTPRVDWSRSTSRLPDEPASILNHAKKNVRDCPPTPISKDWRQFFDFDNSSSIGSLPPAPIDAEKLSRQPRRLRPNLCKRMLDYSSSSLRQSFPDQHSPLDLSGLEAQEARASPQNLRTARRRLNPEILSLPVCLPNCRLVDLVRII